MPKGNRNTITVKDSLYYDLEKFAEEKDVSVSKLVSYLLNYKILEREHLINFLSEVTKTPETITIYTPLNFHSTD